MHFKEIINSIKARREDLGVSQAYLADISGIGLRTIKSFESGKGNPTLNTIQRILDILGLELNINIKNLATTT